MSLDARGLNYPAEGQFRRRFGEGSKPHGGGAVPVPGFGAGPKFYPARPIHGVGVVASVRCPLRVCPSGGHPGRRWARRAGCSPGTRSASCGRPLVWDGVDKGVGLLRRFAVGAVGSVRRKRRRMRHGSRVAFHRDFLTRGDAEAGRSRDHFCVFRRREGRFRCRSMRGG